MKRLLDIGMAIGLEKKRYGDTFPHYWSALSGNVFYHYATITGDKDYLKKAEASPPRSFKPISYRWQCLPVLIYILSLLMEKKEDFMIHMPMIKIGECIFT